MNELVRIVSAQQSVNPEHLTVVKCSEANNQARKLALSMFREKQCFSNALQMSLAAECDFVLGYSYLSEFGITIEHAWNALPNGDHFDATKELFWSLDAEHIELLRLTSHELLMALSNDSNQQGIDHLFLRRSPTYRHFFKQH